MPPGTNATNSHLAAQQLYDLALELEEESQTFQAQLLAEFQEVASRIAPMVGELIVRNEEDEQLRLTQDGFLTGSVVPERDGAPQPSDPWVAIATPEEIVEYLDATDVFAAIAEALAAAFPEAIADSMDGPESGSSVALKTVDIPDMPRGVSRNADSRAGRIRTSDMPDDGELPVLEAEGNGGYIWVFHDKVRIKHHGMRGLVSKGFQKGDKEIWIDQIAGIQWREPGNLWLGHLQFELIGGQSASRVASQDENAVMFDASRRAAFQQVKLAVERRMRDIRAGHSQHAQRPQPAQPAQPDIPEQLSKLASLRDAGVLTNDEFEAKKTELLARM